MNTKSANSSPSSDSSRCHHRFANSQRCQLPTEASLVRPPAARFARPETTNASYCFRHARLPENQREAADLAATLTGGLADFKSPAAINDFLSRLLLLLAQDRISPRRAAVLAYITNQLLRTLSALEQQAAAANDRKNTPVKVIWDVPRPSEERDQTSCP